MNRINEWTRSFSTWAGRVALALVFILSTGVIAAAAQEATEETPPAPQVVEVAAADGLMLEADYYAPTTENAPSVLLMHMYQSSRIGWSLLIPELVQAGYAVLNVDLRGFGYTGGSTDWDAATTDVQTWLDWLRAQPNIRPDAVSIIGASVGSNLALVGCANDAACVTVIALSPGLDYFGVTTSDAIAGLLERSALLVAGQRDRQSADSVKELVSLAQGEIGLQLYRDSRHGTQILGTHRDTVFPLILHWLETHLPTE